ncbi:ABC transporter substrate-binding protein [Gemmatimonadetes bacterium T265]|nr:ABC transporter substrate-binding protein [Gemmatimonadetes bacterium T265]
MPSAVAPTARRPRVCTARRLATGLAAALAVAGVACAGRDAPGAARLTPAQAAALPWDSVVARARGTAVVWTMWRGDPSINRYVDTWVAPRLRQRYGITLTTVEGQGADLVNNLVVERDAGRTVGTTSLVWINGEAFANLRRADLLFGPWAGRAPNGAYVDSASPIVRRDFEQDPAGYESPWGTVQFALIYDTARTPRPPRTYGELGAYVRAHPGRFVHDQSFTGLTFLKGLMYARAGGVRRFQGGFREGDYAAGREAVFAWIDSNRAAFWHGGVTYPAGVAELHRLFANGEIDFTMSNNQNDVVTKVRQGVLPRSARAFLLAEGTIANAHYLAVPFNAPNPAGAMVVADFLLSPEAQFEKQKPEVWDDGTVLARARLPAEWRARFDSVARSANAIPADTLAAYARPEVAPQYSERLLADWRTRVRGR